MPITAADQFDIAEIIEFFDADDTRTMLDEQLKLLDSDACELMADNFKMLYTKYATIRQNRADIDSELYQTAEDRFLEICNVFIQEISKKFGFTVGEDFLEENAQNVANIALPLYLFFVVDFRTNMYNVLLSFINKNRSELAEVFKERANKHDAITSVNKALEDQVVALIASNIYDVIDWCLEAMDAQILFENVEQGYMAAEPVKSMTDNGQIIGMDAAVDTIRDILKTNIPLKARIGFDIICRLKGIEL